MKKHFATLFAAVIFGSVALLSVGCSDDSSYGTPFDRITVITDTEPIDPLPVELTEALFEAAGITSDLMKNRAEEFRAHTLSAERALQNGVYVYSTTVEQYASEPERLAARIAVLGFKDVYLSPGRTAIASADSWLRTFIAALNGYGIRTHAIRVADNALLTDAQGVDRDVALVAEYNAKVARNERFVGISADLEPHTAKGTAHPGPALPYTWDSATNYGKGKDNDRLLALTLDRLDRAGTLLHAIGLSLNEAIFYNYQIYYDRGELSYGSTPQFLASCDYVIVMAYLTSAESIWSRSEPVLKAAAGREASVSICVKTKINTQDSESLQPYGWNYLMETLQQLRDKGVAYESFRGIDFFTYDGNEIMWEWLNDKN